jgi:conjugative relaxase-like TrwC/TraI family protein
MWRAAAHKGRGPQWASRKKRCVISIRRVSLGGGFRYLMESVAAGDQCSRPADGLAAYYAATGTPPGRFLGAGLADLDNGEGLEAGLEVSEQHLRRMLGEMCDPVSGEPVGQTPILSNRRVPVAGFDLTFSPSKSVSVAWALADSATKEVIYDCHRRAIEFVTAYAEQYVFRSRSGLQGMVEEDITGVIAAAFTHWDSRAGDPQLHDHVVVWNRAKSVSDGAWRTLDSRGLFKATVMLSELHQGVLSDLLTETLGVGWDGVERRHSEHRRWEISGVPDTLMEDFSRRSEQVRKRTTELVSRFIDAHSRRPNTTETMRLAQQATLETRLPKAHRSLKDMTGDWRARAEPHLGSVEKQTAWVASLADRNDLPVLHAGDLADEILADAARAAKEAVSGRQATFGQHNVMAEAIRILHGVRFATPGDRVAVAERITSQALAGSLLLNPPALATPPAGCRRPDGSSRLHRESHNIYTTQEILDAEARLLDAGRRIDAPAVSRQTVAQVAELPLAGERRLSVDQALAVDSIAISGRSLDVLIGPAGTGKSTTMAALRAAWETQYGPGSVIGLASSAAAAEALGDEIGIDTENTAKWLTEWRRVPELVTRRQRVTAILTAHSAAGPGAIERPRQQVAELDAQINARRPQPGQLFIVDEASLGGTLALDELVTAANGFGAKVLLVGDPAQLSAVEAGGAFGLVAGDRGDLAPQLGEVRRFVNDWEKAASLDLRVGRPEAIDAYQSHARVVGGDRDQLLEAIYQAWKRDIDTGRSSLMIAGDTATVTELNRRARTDRVAAGEVAQQGVEVASGQTVGVGDLVVTRQNDRRLSADGRWVKNGDRWIVTATHEDSRITVQRTDASGQTVLSAAYAAEHVELAYATTAHQAEGRTVDTGHALVSPTTTREVLYVSASRGRESNRLYVDTTYDPDPQTGHDGTNRLSSPEEVLAGVLQRQGAELSAHEVLLATGSDGVAIQIPNPTWGSHGSSLVATESATLPDC